MLPTAIWGNSCRCASGTLNITSVTPSRAPPCTANPGLQGSSARQQTPERWTQGGSCPPGPRSQWRCLQGAPGWMWRTDGEQGRRWPGFLCAPLPCTLAAAHRMCERGSQHPTGHGRHRCPPKASGSVWVPPHHRVPTMSQAGWHSLRGQCRVYRPCPPGHQGAVPNHSLRGDRWAFTCFSGQAVGRYD